MTEDTEATPAARPPDEDNLITATEAAVLVGVSTSTFMRLVKQGVLPRAANALFVKKYQKWHRGLVEKYVRKAMREAERPRKG